MHSRNKGTIKGVERANKGKLIRGKNKKPEFIVMIAISEKKKKKKGNEWRFYRVTSHTSRHGRREYACNFEQYHGEFLHAMVIAVTSMPNRSLSFQVIFTECANRRYRRRKRTRWSNVG